MKYILNWPNVDGVKRMANKLIVTQTRSTIDRNKKQKRTMIALGIRKMNQTVEHDDTPQIRGMIRRVSHLVRVEELE
jgi:large subunit ribosomal protein L30